MRSQPGGNRFVRPGGAGVGPGAIRAETGGDYVSVGLAWVSHCVTLCVTMRHGSRMGAAWVGHGGVRGPCRHGHGMGMAK